MGEGSWLEGESVGFGESLEFGVTAHFGVAKGDNFITRFELGYSSPNGFDDSGEFRAENLVAGATDAKSQAADLAESGGKVECSEPSVARSYGSGVEFYEDFVVFWGWFGEINDLEDIGRAVRFVDCCAHGVFCSRR